MVLRILVFAMALGIAPAFAQAPATPAPSVAPTPLEQAGTPGSVIPPSQFAAARELVIRSGMSRSFDAAVADMSSQLVADGDPHAAGSRHALETVMEKLTPEFVRQSRR